METPELPALRSYHSWIANETLEDYSLRYTARSFRRWSPFVIANTALGGISFLALETIGGSITLSYGFVNAGLAILVVSLFIFVTSLPIAYYSSKYGIDLDLLTRGAGFGYIGSTITSLIYASFTFIFFALEGAIMAQALKLYADIPLVLGYVISSLVIIPVTLMGITMISRLQMLTQPLWLAMMILPFIMIAAKSPQELAEWTRFAGFDIGVDGFDALAFGASVSIMCSLVVQIGEQADYLRFLPEKTGSNRLAWWSAVVLAGPGWVIIGGLKILAGGLLAVLVLSSGLSRQQALEPIHMFIVAYGYVFENPSLVLFSATLFVLLSQVKINVTNAYAGSLAWSNFFSRVTHYHPGRVVWLIFNILISLLLMLLGIFETLEVVLAVYSNIAMAWVGAIVADLWVLKPLKVSPGFIEFKRAHLRDFNPVGCGGMAFGSIVAIIAFTGVFGDAAQAYCAPLSFLLAFLAATLIGVATRGRYYLARPPVAHFGRDAGPVIRCEICDHGYERDDMAYCSFYERPICSLCCSLDAHCHDACKKSNQDLATSRSHYLGEGITSRIAPHMPQRLLKVGGVLIALTVVTAALFLLTYRLIEPGAETPHLDNGSLLLRVFLALLPLLAISAWWIVLSNESRELAQRNLVSSLEKLHATRAELTRTERLAAIGQLTATVSHELRNPLGTLMSSVAVLKRTGKFDSHDVHDEIDRIQRNVRRCVRIIEDLLEFSRRPNVSMVPLALDAWIIEHLTDLKSLSPVHLELHLGCDRMIEADGERLRQVLVNVVQNAMQAVQECPSAARPGKVTIATACEDDRVCITVSDNGIGMSEEVQARLFEPLFSTKPFGLGLGLALVRRIVERHGGSVRITSVEQEGTCVEIRLPAASGEWADVA
ncbi:integral membrane sensor signal transduction histidine kinase [Ancylobacter novellus DSM 506]|uniref:histidine kinase n=1 Tax=Ancylobacter novellus (strain ATCC 8093 / DSM 506 / JCM 20403 / CCM 1077 / IAM 12100 / NBRC 12443 / NCIMB 10456) TaxID=639283 RepID=D7A7P9_ANCN5|nr:ATP-binding protein [Ancylobacter novellus]ADH88497.1 integral membrane sensor signal transduction histidine kinase [Ancylobacter novellus DSM 506]